MCMLGYSCPALYTFKRLKELKKVKVIPLYAKMEPISLYELVIVIRISLWLLKVVIFQIEYHFNSVL